MSVLFNEPSLKVPINAAEGISQMKITLAGLAYECPHEKRTKDCPLSEIEHLTFKEKLVWIDQLTQDRKMQIMNFHYCCSYSRESK